MNSGGPAGLQKICKPYLRKIVQYVWKGRMRSRMKKTKAAGIEIEMGPIEQEDFDWIVSQNQKRIYRTLLLLVRDADAAEVLTQECFLRAFPKRGEFRGESALTTWLVRIAVNLARDHNRRLRFHSIRWILCSWANSDLSSDSASAGNERGATGFHGFPRNPWRFVFRALGL